MDHSQDRVTILAMRTEDCGTRIPLRKLLSPES